MNRSPETVDAAFGAWSLVETHLHDRDDDRAVLLGGDLPADYWRRIANHLAEQLGHQIRREFEHNAADLLAGVRRIVLAEASGGGTAGGSL